MDLTLRQIRAFVTVARLGNFTRAASALHLSQPALTVQIKKLEETLRCKLLDRNSRAVQLTGIGQQLLPLLQRTLQDIELVVGDAHEQNAGRRGTIRIASLPSFSASLLPDVIAKCRQAEPGLDFQIRDAVANRVMELLRTEQVDLAIAAGAIELDQVDVLYQAKDHLCLVIPKAHPLARKRRILVNDLLELPLVMTDPATSVRATVDAAFLAAGRQPRIACETTYMITALAMVRAGLGATVLPSSAREIRIETGLCAKLIEDPTFVRSIFLAKKRARTISPACLSFAELCKSMWHQSSTATQ